MNKYKTALYNITETDDVDKRIEYRSLLQELVNKATPKKPVYVTDGCYDEDGELFYDSWICPNCHTEYDIDYDGYNFCNECGQALDWSDEE